MNVAGAESAADAVDEAVAMAVTAVAEGRITSATGAAAGPIISATDAAAGPTTSAISDPRNSNNPDPNVPRAKLCRKASSHRPHVQTATGPRASDVPISALL